MNYPVTDQKPMVYFEDSVVDFALEKYSNTLLDEMRPLFEDHYKELALYKDIELKPDLAIYATAQINGMLRIFTARYKGKLVGYEVFFLHNHPHFSESKNAVQDVLFLSLEMRRGTIGYRFIKWCDEQLNHEGVKVVFRYVNAMRDYSALLTRLGYQKHDVVYSRRAS